MTLLIQLTTVPQTLFFFSGQADFLRAHGFEVRAISSPGSELDRFSAEERLQVDAVPMRRSIAPLADLIAIFRLWKRFRALKPDIVHAHTPKGGLLGMIAATLAGIPFRVYHVHGLPMVTSRGVRRMLLAAAERVACRLAHRVFCVSHSVRELAIAEGLVAANRIEVIGPGSINGVDAEHRFIRSSKIVAAGRAVRERYGIPHSAVVIGFVGRLVRDKGVGELALAWASLRERVPDCHLLLVGGEEARDAIAPGVLHQLHADTRAHMLGHQMEIASLYAAMDLLALPTYREGFVVTALEAAAMELPIVGTDVPGCRDAIIDGQTGTLVPAGGAASLERALEKYMLSPDLRQLHGKQGRARVRREFRPEILWNGLLEVYRKGPPSLLRCGAHTLEPARSDKLTP
jgi:glycosyltransferase involved in cell wall biosynthesis